MVCIFNPQRLGGRGRGRWQISINSRPALVYITSSKIAKATQRNSYLKKKKKAESVCVSVCVTKDWMPNLNLSPQRQRQTAELRFKVRLIYISIPGQPKLHNETQSQNKGYKYQYTDGSKNIPCLSVYSFILGISLGTQ